MEEFFKLLAPVLAANLLTVMLIYSFVSYDRLEKEGRHESWAGFSRLMTILMCIAFLLYGMHLYGAF